MSMCTEQLLSAACAVHIAFVMLLMPCHVVQGTMLTSQISLTAKQHATQMHYVFTLARPSDLCNIILSIVSQLTQQFCSVQQTYIAELLQSGEAKSRRVAGGTAACPAAHFGPAGAAQAGLGVMQSRPCS